MTQVNSAFHMHWEAFFGSYQQVLFTSEQPKRKKLCIKSQIPNSFFVTLKEINLLLNFFGFSIAYNEIIIHFSVGRSDGYIPCRSAAR